MPRSTAEALKQIQKQGLSISIISADSLKPVAVEAGPKEMRAKHIAVVNETLPNNLRSTSSSENKPTVSQVRQNSNPSIETRSANQSSLLLNQTAQTGSNNKLSPVSSTSEIKLQNLQKLNNPNCIDNKTQFSTSNRNSQIEKNQSNVVRLSQNSSFSESKAQSNRNLSNISGPLEVKSHKNNPNEPKTPIIHSRTQNLTTDSKVNSNQSRLSVVSPPLENKTNSNTGKLLSQNNSTPVLDKSVGPRNQLLMTEIKAPNQCKIIPVKQCDNKTVGMTKSHSNVKVITQPKAISQLQPSAVRISGINNAKQIVNKSSANTLSERSLNNPFRVASTLMKEDEKPVFKVIKVTQNAATPENQTVQPKMISMPLKSENKGDIQSIKVSELPFELLQKSVQIENSSEAQSMGINMPRAAIKRVAIASSTPGSPNKRKCIKIASPSFSEQSGNQSDTNTLSSDESPVKEKINIGTLTSGLTITPVCATPCASTSTKKSVEPKQNIIVVCPSCKQFSYSTTSCDSCHEVFTSPPPRYHLKSAPRDSASIVVTQNVTTSIEKSMKIVYRVGSNPGFKFQQRQQVIKVSPRRGRPKRRYVEPICYTLSSDEEEEESLPFESIPDDMNSQILYSHDLEENQESEHSSNSDMMPEENIEFDEPIYPGVTRIKDQFLSQPVRNYNMEEGEEDEEQEDEEIEHGMESEEEIMGEVGVEQPEFDEDELEEDELEDEEDDMPLDEEERIIPHHNKKVSVVPNKIVLQCRSIRIGSYKVHPKPTTKCIEVTLTNKSLYFEAPNIIDEKTVPLVLNAGDTADMMIHFGKCLPIIFVRTSERFGDYAKKLLCMTKTLGELFMPGSEDVKKNKLTFLIDTLTDDQRTFMRQIYPGPERLKEIDQKSANEILVKSTPPSSANNVVKISRTISVQDSQVSSSPSSQVSVTVPGHPLSLSTQALSITKVTPKPDPPKPVVKLLTYPPPPQTGGIAINTADFATLDEGEFLNDAILDFYLKYVFYEKLSDRDREKTHIFSSFFYPRLTQKPDRLKPGDDGPKTMQVRRHNQVKTWTKHVDIFSKDYIVIPVNQHNHWFLAFICYPGHIPDAPVEKIEPKTAKIDTVTSSNDHVINKVIIKEETNINEDSQSQGDNINNDSSYEVEEPPDSDEENSSELPERSTNSNVTYYEGGRRKETPCILIFDSLSGPNRWRIASTLREYLEMEWKIRKGTKKVFDKNTMQGFIVKCPQQTNFSDCGLYVLQYVESFFENPIPYFGHPMPDLTNWFTDTKISKKRQEIKELITSLQKKYLIKQAGLSGVTIKKIIQPSASPTVSSTQTDNR